MSDTKRTLTEILALFADNVTAQISAQDLRDFVVSVFFTTPIEVDTATYDLDSDDVAILHVTRTTVGVCAIDIKSAQIAEDGAIFHIKDAGGNCNANNITITTEGAETIDGAANAVMDIDYMCLGLYAMDGNLFSF